MSNFEEWIDKNQQANIYRFVAEMVSSLPEKIIEQNGKINEKQWEAFIKRLESLKPVEQIEAEKSIKRMDTFIRYIEQVRLWNESVAKLSLQLDNYARENFEIAYRHYLEVHKVFGLFTTRRIRKEASQFANDVTNDVFRRVQGMLSAGQIQLAPTESIGSLLLNDSFDDAKGDFPGYDILDEQEDDE